MHEPHGTKKIVACTGGGAFFGTVIGTVESIWHIPKLGENLPRFITQVKHIGGRSLVFASAAGLFASIEYAAECFRSKKDYNNAAIAGCLAAGAIVSIRSADPRMAASAALIGGVSSGALSYWSTLANDPFEQYAATRKASQTS